VACFPFNRSEHLSWSKFRRTVTLWASHLDMILLGLWDLISVLTFGFHRRTYELKLTGLLSLKILMELTMKSHRLEQQAYKKWLQDSCVWILHSDVNFSFVLSSIINHYKHLCSYHFEMRGTIHWWEAPIDKEIASNHYSYIPNLFLEFCLVWWILRSFT
jgi:hypothetical protein